MASREYNQAYYQANKARRVAWRKENTAKIREQTAAYRLSHKQQRRAYLQTPARRFAVYKHNARVKGIQFDLSITQFTMLTTQPCHYCGSGGEHGYVGVDRLNGKDYHIDTCVPCCEMCNYMKCDYSEREFLDQIQKIANHNK